MHQLWQHPNGTFYILYGPRLTKRVSTRTRERGAAERVLAPFIAGASAPVVEQPTSPDILRGYPEERAPEIRAAETLRFNVQVLIRHIGLLQPMHLLPAIIRDYAKKRTAEGVKPGTILREVGVLRAALAWAVTNQWIEKKPEISNPVKTPPPRDRWLTKDEARKLIVKSQ